LENVEVVVGCIKKRGGYLSRYVTQHSTPQLHFLWMEC
jgi:hypothetical protein